MFHRSNRLAKIFIDLIKLCFVKDGNSVMIGSASSQDGPAIGIHGIGTAFYPFRTDDWPIISPEPNWAPDLAARKAANEKNHAAQ